MKKLIIAVIAAVSLCGFAEDAKPQKKVLTPEEKAAAKERMLQKTGGIIERAGVGKVAVVNCQDKFGKDKIAAKTEEFKKYIRVDMTTIDGAKINAANALTDCRKLPAGVTAALYVVDDPALPMSLASVEEQWALINVAHLENELRFNKQFARGVIMAFGGGVSQYKGSPMQVVRKPEDLDKIVSQTLALDNLTSIRRNLDDLGVKAPMKSTYRKACMDGWAAAPTNSYQKAIWDEVHAMPDKPLTIKKQK